MRPYLTIWILLFSFLITPGKLWGEERPVKLSTSAEKGFTKLVFDGRDFHFEAAIDQVILTNQEFGYQFSSIEITGFYLNGEPGSPALPLSSLLFEAPDLKRRHIRVELLDSVVFDLEEMGVTGIISPVHQETRKGSPNPGLLIDSAVYLLDEWLGGPVIRVEYEGRMRGLEMCNLHFSPVQYNPVRKQLKVYSRVRCIIESGRVQAVPGLADGAFSNLFGRVVRQDNITVQKAVEAERPMTLVILSDTIFREALQPLVEWKSRKGFRVVEAYRHDSLAGGTRKTMKAYLETLYHYPPDGIAPPTYLLIVGDVEHIPLSQYSGQVTDLYYATYDGEGDYIPDLFYGRISVASPKQLEGVVEKILEYEQHLFPDPSFLERSVLIAGVDGVYAGTYGNGQINYAGAYYLNAGMGREAYLFPYPESHTSGGEIIGLISGGVGFVNYTGHGLTDRWEDPAFTTGHIDQLQNQGMYPVMIGNGCETNRFSVGECFAEALVRAPGKGALAYIGCTNDSYWDEDYYWSVGLGAISSNPGYEVTTQGYFDKVFHTHGEAHELWTPSLGEMIFGGNMAVQQSSTHRKQFYWEIYQLAGDPSIVPWFSQPAKQQVIHPSAIPAGVQRVDVRCDPYSYVALSHEGRLLDARHADPGGFVTLWFDTISSGALDLMVTGDAHQPYSSQVELGNRSGSYLDLLGHKFAGESHEEDGLLTPGEEVSLSLELMNRGVEAIVGDTLLLTWDQNSLIVSDSLYPIDLLAAGDTLVLSEVFRFQAGHYTADQSSLVLGVGLSGGGPRLFIPEVVSAPKLVSNGILWDDRPLGNGNGIVEPGERLLCRWRLQNNGHFKTGEITGREYNSEQSLFSQIHFDHIPLIHPGEEADLQFSFQVADSGEGDCLSGYLSAGDIYSLVEDSLMLSIGRHFEDFSRGVADSYPFENRSPIGWQVEQGSAHSQDKALRSGRVSHSQVSSISLQFTTSEVDTLSFYYRVSSEKYYDFLELSVDSAIVKSWSGENVWDHYEVILDGGFHEISWTYRKDKNVSMGEDAAWIDDISFPVSAFRKGDLSLMAIENRDAAPWEKSVEQVEIRVGNTSADTLEGFFARFFLDGIPFSEESSREVLMPGEEVIFSPASGLSLPGTGVYMLSAELIDSSGYSGNNRLEKELLRYSFPDISLAAARIVQNSNGYPDVVITIENTGNIRVDSMEFGVWLDQELHKSGTRYLGLAPGGIVEEIFMLAEPGDQIISGTHEYLVRMLTTDSIQHNNELSGVLTWYPESIGKVRETLSWMVFPNPSSGTFYIYLDQPATEELIFELWSISGQMEGRFIVKKGESFCMIPSWTIKPGIYLLRNVESGTTLRVVSLVTY
ncbi:MAG: hypothetical protein GY790_14900 [Bacteroidetes bacterium]|nr:hypothetical protein [Bacteroidota bacterium]